MRLHWNHVTQTFNYRCLQLKFGAHQSGRCYESMLTNCWISFGTRRLTAWTHSILHLHGHHLLSPIPIHSPNYTFLPSADDFCFLLLFPIWPGKINIVSKASLAFFFFFFNRSKSLEQLEKKESISPPDIWIGKEGKQSSVIACFKDVSSVLEALLL